MIPQPLISIIIPIYNGEKYIDGLYNQLIDQTYTNFECIMVDDGSTDNSLELLNTIVNKDLRFNVYSHENKGLSIARNTGLEYIKGDYVTFIDVDDTVSVHLLSEFIKHLIKVDAEIFSVQYAQNFNGKIITCDLNFEKNKLLDSTYIQNVIIKELLSTDNFAPVWSKFYKVNFINENNLRFPDSRYIEEDINFNLKAYNLCNSTYNIDFVGYYYTYNPNGLSKNILSKDFFKIANEKFNYNYKSNLNLKIDKETLDECNSIRYIQKMIWLFFMYAREKKLSLKESNDIILNNVLNDEFLLLVKKYFKHPKIKKGVVQYFVLKNICSKNTLMLKCLIFIFKTLYFEGFVLKLKKFI